MTKLRIMATKKLKSFPLLEPNLAETFDLKRLVHLLIC